MTQEKTVGIDGFEGVLESEGVSLYGAADVSRAVEQIATPHRDAFGDDVFAVSLGIALPNPVVDGLRPYSVAAAMLYKQHGYDVINRRLDHATSRVAQSIEAAGFLAVPVPASQSIDGESLQGLFPHKTAARLAGLGWIGKSCLLVTPKFGPRIRFATVLTDMPLEAAANPMEPGCGECTACVHICPVGAFTGRPFDEEEGREARFAAPRCRDHLDRRKEETGLDVCGLCLYVCPFGKAKAASG